MPEKKSPSAAATGTGGKGDTGVHYASQHTTDVEKTQTLAAWALRYAMAGWRVLPLLPGTKEPATTNGWHDATADLEQIERWWRRLPDANIGIALTPLDGAYSRVAFDVDPRHGGKLDYVTRLGIDPAQTVTQRTRSDGWHVLYERPAQIDLRSKVIDAPGLDVLTTGYIVAAPSVIDGKVYRWERNPIDYDLARLPLEIAEHLRKPSTLSALDVQRPTTAGPAADDAPPLHVLEHALAHLDPWAGNYAWWLDILMGLHHAYPGSDGLALAERWGDGRPGEIASKWATFDRAGGVTWRTLWHHAKSAGWRPELASNEQPTHETAHAILHEHLARHGGTCDICGRAFFETRNDGASVHGRRRVMMCHKRGCEVWQHFRATRQISEAEPWTWPAWFASEHDPETWRRLIDGPLAERADWLGAPLANGNVVLFSAWAPAGRATSISLRIMLEMSADAILGIPPGKRLRRPKSKARAKRLGLAEQTAETPQERQRWTRWAFGLDLLDDRGVLTVLAIIERCGGTVDARRGRFQYPVALDGTIRDAVADWMRPERSEIDAYTPPAEYASISATPPLPEQPGYQTATPRARKFARIGWLEDTERDYRVREAQSRL